VNEALERKADMIVIGRRGRKGLAKLLIGEVAAKVIGHAPCKVLVVPKASQIRCKNILVATNGSEQSGAAVSAAIEIAKCCSSSIVAVSVMSSDHELEKARSNVDKVVELTREEGLGLKP
jgi:nucleotide-binding universal stress UspA family protein